MNHEALTQRDHPAAYLQHVQALASEISRAMECIATNTLPGFRESVAEQEMLCAQLTRMTCSGSPAMRSTDPALDLSIRQASAAVRELNLQYAALLQHSGKSVNLLASLCRTFTGQFQEARGTRSKHQTWSCEM